MMSSRMPPLLAASALATMLLAPPCHAAGQAGASADKASADDSATFTGKLAADHLLRTAGGTTLTAPRDWSVWRDGPLLLLDAPEADSHLAILDVQASDADDAIRQAWTRYRPSDRHTYKLLTERATHEGWEQRKVADYDTPPNERSTIEAVASRHGDHWNVILLDASEQTAAKRGAALAPHLLTPERIELLRAFLADAMTQLAIPGAGFALMDHNRVVYEGGVGVREQGKPDPVDADTLFMAASNAKGMSTLLLAMLVDDGKLRWDE